MEKECNHIFIVSWWDYAYLDAERIDGKRAVEVICSLCLKVENIKRN